MNNLIHRPKGMWQRNSINRSTSSIVGESNWAHQWSRLLWMCGECNWEITSIGCGHFGYMQTSQAICWIWPFGESSIRCNSLPDRISRTSQLPHWRIPSNQFIWPAWYHRSNAALSCISRYPSKLRHCQQFEHNQTTKDYCFDGCCKTNIVLVYCLPSC